MRALGARSMYLSVALDQQDLASFNTFDFCLFLLLVFKVCNRGDALELPFFYVGHDVGCAGEVAWFRNRSIDVRPQREHEIEVGLSYIASVRQTVYDMRRTIYRRDTVMSSIDPATDPRIRSSRLETCR